MKTRYHKLLYVLPFVLASCEPDFDFDLFDTGCLGCEVIQPLTVTDPYVAGTYTISYVDEGIRHQNRVYDEYVYDTSLVQLGVPPLKFQKLVLYTDSTFIGTSADKTYYGTYKHGKDFNYNDVRYVLSQIVLFLENTEEIGPVTLSFASNQSYYTSSYSVVYLKDGEQVAAYQGIGGFYWNPELYNGSLFDEAYIQYTTYYLQRISVATD